MLLASSRVAFGYGRCELMATTGGQKRFAPSNISPRKSTAGDRYFRSSLADKQRFCQDPAGYVCMDSELEPKFPFMDSRCRFIPPNYTEFFGPVRGSSDLALEKALFKRRADRVRRTGNCSDFDSCHNHLKLHYASELAREKWRMLATPRKLEMIKEIFRASKRAIVAELKRKKESASTRNVLGDSKLIDALIARVIATRLELWKYDELECQSDENLLNAGYSESGYINICLGLIHMVDRLHPAVAYQTIGHELGHAFDPCIMEYYRLAPMATIEAFHSPLTKCFGRNGIRTVNIFPDEKARRAWCDETTTVYPDQKSCDAFIATVPSCNVPIHPSLHIEENQSIETFADYFGAVAVAAYLKGKSEAERMDAGVAMAQKYLEDAYTCDITADQNSRDRHLFGRARVERALHRMQPYLEAIGCAPSIKRAAPTCSF